MEDQQLRLAFDKSRVGEITIEEYTKFRDKDRVWYVATAIALPGLTDAKALYLHPDLEWRESMRKDKIVGYSSDGFVYCDTKEEAEERLRRWIEKVSLNKLRLVPRRTLTPITDGIEIKSVRLDANFASGRWFIRSVANEKVSLIYLHPDLEWRTDIKLPWVVAEGFTGVLGDYAYYGTREIAEEKLKQWVEKRKEMRRGEEREAATPE